MHRITKKNQDNEVDIEKCLSNSSKNETLHYFGYIPATGADLVTKSIGNFKGRSCISSTKLVAKLRSF
jgi:hypothetical protein